MIDLSVFIRLSIKGDVMALKVCSAVVSWYRSIGMENCCLKLDWLPR
jgi:hypothetical protein